MGFNGTFELAPFRNIEEQEAIDMVIDVNIRQDNRLSVLMNYFLPSCRLPGRRRAFLLWDGCVRQRREHFTWPSGFRAKWDTSGYRGLCNARSNGPPRTAFKVAGGDYRGGSEYELAHLYEESVLLYPERHFTQGSNLICMPRQLHRESERNIAFLWILRGLPFFSHRYDPLEKFSSAEHDRYGFVVDDQTCEVFWP